MQFGIIKERKNPPDRRVVFTPEELVRLQKEYPEAKIKVESSGIRIFKDEEYTNLGIEVADDISDCDVFFGVKEIPVEYLIPNKNQFSNESSANYGSGMLSGNQLRDNIITGQYPNKTPFSNG